MLSLGPIASWRRWDVELLADLSQPDIGDSVFLRSEVVQRGFPNLFVKGLSVDFHGKEWICLVERLMAGPGGSSPSTIRFPTYLHHVLHGEQTWYSLCGTV